MSDFETLLLIIAVALSIGLAWMIWCYQQLKNNEQQSHDKAPIGLVRQRLSGGQIYLSGMAQEILKTPELVELEDLQTLFSREHATRFIEALKVLKAQDEDLSLTLDGQDSKTSFHLEGSLTGDYVNIWIEDASLLAWLGQLSTGREKEINALQSLLNQLPIPVWWRRVDDLAMIGCNDKYCELVGDSREHVLFKQLELGRGVIAEHGLKLAQRAKKTSNPQSESHYLIVDGNRRLFDFTEASLSDGGAYILGYAVDMTHIEESQATLATHVAAHDQVLDHMRSAISIYGPDRRLKFYNDAYLVMWNLTNDLIHEGMYYGEVMELLRARRQLPEIIDFPAYKKERETKFNSLIDPEEELIHLPDERAIRMVSSPHPFGGLMFTFDDVTDRLALERSYNTLIAVQQETLNNLYEGVAVFGSDGRLSVWNKVYSDLWDLPENVLSHGPHVSELLDMSKGQFATGKNWDQRRQKLVLSVIEPKPHHRRIERIDGVVIDVAHVPLPDGQCLVLYQDVTTAAKVEKALVERNIAFEKADMLKSQFVSNVSYELRTPLNAIQGFSEILHSQHFGELNTRQTGQVESILDATNILMSLINDVLDLASLQAGFMRIDPTSNRISDVLQDEGDELSGRLEERKLTFNLTCSDEIGMLVFDRKRLFQVIRNLADNVLKFAQRGKNLDINASMQGHFLEMQFIAGGYVTSREDREFLIKRFEGHEAHALRTGAGLGLSLAKSLIDLHGGTIDLNVGVEGGAEIKVTLPVNEEPTDQVRILIAQGEGKQGR